MCALAVKKCVCVPSYSVCVHKAGDCIAALQQEKDRQKKKAAKQITFCDFPIFLSLPLSMHVCVPSLCDQAQCVCVKAENKKRMVKPEVSYRV